MMLGTTNIKCFSQFFFLSALLYLFFFPIASPMQGIFLQTLYLYASLGVRRRPIKSGTNGWTFTKCGINVVLFYITPHQ